MKSFTFHLQKILDLKEKQKEQAQWEFGKSMQRKNEEEAKLLKMTSRFDDLTQSLVSIQHETCQAASLIQLSMYKQSMAKAITHQQRTIRGCVQEMERCQTTLTLRRQESELWIRLKDNAKNRFEEEQKHSEQQFLDELGITSYLRRAKA